MRFDICGQPDCAPCNPSRRSFVSGLFAASAVASVPAAPALAQGAANPRRIDVHHHLSPPAYLDELAPMKRLTPLTMNWTPAKAIEQMDQGGVEVSITSITTPGIWFGSHAPARRLARACNDYAAKLVLDHPKRFGMFVNLPLPDVDGTLKEIEYGLDVLKADGIAMFTSYGDKWIGDPAFDPVFEELNRRKAVIYTHPNTANCCTNLVPGAADSTTEYGPDTTRAIARMVFGGAASRFPDVKLIWSHGGGTLPYVIDRFIRDGSKPPFNKFTPNGFMPEALKFYYDVSQIPNKGSLYALKSIFPASRLLFGSDFPYLTSEYNAKGVIDSGLFSAEEMRAIDRGNAELLIPKYKS